MVIEDPDVRAMRTKMASEDDSVSSNIPGDLTESESRTLENEEWASRLRSLRNNGTVFVGIVCVQLPFELVYAHLNKIAYYDVIR